MCDFNTEGPDAFTERWRTARAEHECCACRETIRVGDRYKHSSGVWDGNPASFKHCARCAEVLDILVRENPDGVDLELNCGEVYEGDNPRMYELAFMTPEQAQRELARG